MIHPKVLQAANIDPNIWSGFAFGMGLDRWTMAQKNIKDIKKIRIVNLVGCILFVIYGVFSNYLWPIIIPNAILCVIQAYHLLKKGE